MDQISRGLQTDDGLKVSISDSTLMMIVHRSMDRAHKRVKSKKGALERLGEISKFYLLAIIELEGCLKFVEEQTGNYLLSSHEEKVLAELTEMRDHLMSRLKETDLGFLEKDKELRERSVNELKLRQALEMKEKELVALRANLEHGNHESDDTEKEGEFSELKLSVDQQVLNIKQQLEPDYESTGSRKIDRMGSDINFLKETLDLAFGKMHNAIFLSELGPNEHEWMCNVERGTTAIVIRDFLKGFQESFGQQAMKQKADSNDGLSKNLLDLMQEINGLYDEIQLLSPEDEIPMKNSVPLPPQTNPEDKDTLKGKGKTLSRSESSCDNSEDYSFKEDSDKSCQNHVAKIVKNHESIIRKKSEELSYMKREILRERACAAFTKKAESVKLTKKLQKIARALEALVNCSKMASTSSDSNNYNVTETFHGIKSAMPEIRSKEMPGAESFEEVWAKVNKLNESSDLNEDKNANFIKHDTLSMNESVESIKTTIQNDILRVLFHELFVQWNIEVDSCKIKHAVEEELQGFVFSKVLEEALGVNEEAKAVNINKTPDSSLSSHDAKENEDDNERKTLAQTLHRLSKSLENDEALMQSAHTEIIESVLKETATFSQSDLEKKNICSSVCRKLEKAQTQLQLGKALLNELQICVGLAVSDTNTNDPEPRVELSEFVLTVVQDFSKELKDFERITNTRLWRNAQRLRDIKEEVDQIVSESKTFGPKGLVKLSQFIFTVVHDFSKELKHFEHLTEARLWINAQRLGDIKEKVDQIVDDSKTLGPEQVAKLSQLVFTVVQDFSKELKHFEQLTETRLLIHAQRLGEIKEQLDQIFKLVASMSKREAVYKNAFFRRCENLQKAENEVDALADQVEVLLAFLKKLYKTLHQHSHSLQHYFEVSDVLNLIKKEISQLDVEGQRVR